MIILDTIGDTIRAEASAASSITVTCYGIETVSGSETYKKLGQLCLTGSGTQDTVYTVPVNSSAICATIVVANISNSAKTIKLWHVPSGESVGDGYLLFGTLTILANTTVVWNKGNIQSCPEMETAGDNHNSLSGLQGGTTDEYYHLTSNQHLNILIGEYVAAYGGLEITR